MTYTYEIEKQFHFSASHQLAHLPDGHQCSRLHGHNYIVVVVLGADDLNDDGFVLDYGELKPFKQYIDDTVEHKHLNDVFDFKTTAENLSRHFFEWCRYEQGWQQVIEVRVSETPKTWAAYRPKQNKQIDITGW